MNRSNIYKYWMLLECFLLALVLSNEVLLILNLHFMGLGRTTLILLLFLVIVRLMLRNTKEIKIPIIILISLLLTSIGLTISLIFGAEVQRYIEFLGGIIILSVIPFTWTNPRKTLYNFSFFFVLLNFILVIEMFLTNGNIFAMAEGQRLAPSEANPIFWGRTAAISLVFTIILFLERNKFSYQIKVGNILLILLMVVFFFAVLFSNSRGPMLALFIAFLVFNIYLLYKVNIKNKIIILLTEGGLILLLYIFLKDTVFMSRLFNANLQAQENVSNRLEYWQAAFQAIIAEPFFGSQAHLYYDHYSSYPHNLILDLGLHGGLITITAFFILIIKVIYDLIFLKDLKTQSLFLITSLLSILIISLVTSMFSGTIDSHYFIWFTSSFIVAIKLKGIKEREQNENRIYSSRKL